MPTPIACLLTWTCYGTWLHGDERGSVDRAHNVPGEPGLPGSTGRRRVDLIAMKHAALWLGPEARRVVSATVAAHCVYRGWTLHAVNVRSNHVHAVVSCDVAAADDRLRHRAAGG